MSTDICVEVFHGIQIHRCYWNKPLFTQDELKKHDMWQSVLPVFLCLSACPWSLCKSSPSPLSYVGTRQSARDYKAPFLQEEYKGQEMWTVLKQHTSHVVQNRNTFRLILPRVSCAGQTGNPRTRNRGSNWPQSIFLRLCSDFIHRPVLNDHLH